MTGLRWKGSCSCSTPAAGGGTCPSSWAAGPGTPRGGGYERGRTPACGTGCTNSSSTNSPKLSCWTGHGPASTECRCGANGLPLHALLSAANTHDRTLFEPLLETNPAVRGRRGRPGRPRRRPDKLHADKGYDYRRCREYLHGRGIKVRIARRGIEDKSKLGRVRWVVERTISWLLRFKRLGLRYDRTERTTLPLLTLACTVINVRRLIKTEF
jgi:transposase